jgi:hypothetical protein
MASVRAYFSGVESRQHWQACVDAEVKHVLLSYWQFQKSDPNIIRDRKRANPNVRFMIDSGAHTFIADLQKGSAKFGGWKRADYDAYVKRYVEWLKRNAQYLECAVEFDIDAALNWNLTKSWTSTLGPSIVESWQQEHFAPFKALGLDIIYVWHHERKMEGWEQMCQRFDYVGLPGELSRNEDFNKFIAVARRYTTRIHGFAATKQSDFRDFPWYSIDSITWKTGEMYGTLIDWNPNSQRLSFKEKEDRPTLRVKFERNGFDAEGIINDTAYKEVTRYSLWSMRQMEKYYADKYKDRTFYYELRLPLPVVIKRWKGKKLWRKWNLYRPATVFRQHADTKNLAEVESHLCAISAVQNGDWKYLGATPTALAFLKTYFPKLADPLTQDVALFQKEMAVFTAPPNPPPLPRSEPEHYQDNTNAPKRRDEAVVLKELAFNWQVQELLDEESLRFNYLVK